MNINLSNSFNELSQSTNVNNSEQMIKEAISVVKNQNITGESILKEMQAGDVFRGEIVNINNYDVTILLGKSGEYVNAVMQQAMNFNIGDKLLFQLKDKSDNQIVIRPVANNEVSPELVNKSLSMAGLSLTDKNVAIVKELIGQGQPIDKNSIMNIIRLTSKYSAEPIDKLINMNKNGIEINSENLKQYDLYSTSNHQLSEGVKNLSENIVKFVSDMSVFEEAKGMSFNDNLNNITDLFNKLSQAVEENPDNEIPDNEIPDKSEPKLLVKPELTVKDSLVKNENINNIIKNVDTMLENAKTFSDISNIVNYLKNSGMENSKISEFLKSGKLAGKIKGVFEKEVFIDTQNMESNGESIKEEITKLYNKINKIADAINESNVAKNTDLSNSAKDIKGNLSFLNELNYNCAFVQLPIKLSSGEANGDLYVFNRKKNNRNLNDRLTAFLHLDLENLGATEVYITMDECQAVKPVVTTKFTLADEKAMELVEKHLDELKERLEALGYKVSIQTEGIKKEEVFNALLPVTSNNENSVSIKRYTLDLRT